LPDVKDGAKQCAEECNADGRIHRINHKASSHMRAVFDWILVLRRRCKEDTECRLQNIGSCTHSNPCFDGSSARCGLRLLAAQR
jgi:hypothetical protein